MNVLRKDAEIGKPQNSAECNAIPAEGTQRV
jgi:hypothetical protein